MSLVHAILNHTQRGMPTRISPTWLTTFSKRMWPEHASLGFKDPTDDSLHKMCNTNWIKDTLSRTGCDDNLEEGTIHELTECDQDYELFDVT